MHGTGNRWPCGKISRRPANTMTDVANRCPVGATEKTKHKEKNKIKGTGVGKKEGGSPRHLEKKQGREKG